MKYDKHAPSPKDGRRACLCPDGKKPILENAVMVATKHKV